MEKDAMDAIVRYGEHERCEWLVLVVEDEGRLPIELMYFDLQVRAAGCRRDERGDLPGAVERRLKVANAFDAPASRPTICDHQRAHPIRDALRPPRARVAVVFIGMPPATRPMRSSRDP